MRLCRFVLTRPTPFFILRPVIEKARQMIQKKQVVAWVEGHFEFAMENLFNTCRTLPIAIPRG